MAPGLLRATGLNGLRPCALAHRRMRLRRLCYAHRSLFEGTEAMTLASAAFGAALVGAAFDWLFWAAALASGLTIALAAGTAALAYISARTLDASPATDH